MRNRVIQFSSLILIIITILLVGFFYYQRSVKASEMSNRLKGEILLQVEQNGEAWYVYPNDEKRYYLGRPDDAFNIMRKLGLGISNNDLAKIQVAKSNYHGYDSDGDGLSDMFEDAIGTNKFEIDTDQDSYTDFEEFFNNYNTNGLEFLIYDNNFASLYQGTIFLQVEQNGEAWYVNPEDNLRYYLGRPADAFSVMRNLGLGITDQDLSLIEEESLGEEYYIAPASPSQEPESPSQDPQEPDSEPICTNECNTLDIQQCSGNGFQTCGNFDADDCYEWSEINYCDEGNICQDGVCINEPVDCTNECNTLASQQCSGNGYQTCGNYDDDECYEWSIVTDCLQDYTCSDGICNPPVQLCTNECNTLDIQQCSGNGYQTCGNYDDDDCLEWGTAVSCNQGYECSSGKCVLSGLGSSCPFFAVSLNNSYLNGTSGLGSILEQSYQDALTDLFQWSMPAGTGKWLWVHPEEDVYNPNGILYTLDWLASKGMSYNIYHNVVVPKLDKIPEWFWALSSPEERQIALEDHVRSVMTFFGDQIPIYNVVNHVYNNHFKNIPDSYLFTGWDRITAITNILSWAREANPNVKLIINEGGDTDVDGVIIHADKRANYIQFLTDLINNGAELDGLGLMGHFGNDVGQGAGKLPSDVLRAALEDYSQFGLPIYITEFDLSYSFILDEDPNFDPDNPFETYDSWWEYQADAYLEAFEIFQEFSLVKMVHFWSLYDGDSWMPGAGLFDANLNPKPVYYTLENFLREAKNRQCSIN